MPVTISSPRTGLGEACRTLLDALPSWFGIPEANDRYIEFADSNPTWIATTDDGSIVGLLSPLRHPRSLEIRFVAVHPAFHRQGIGRALVETFERAALAADVPIVQVKTLGPSDPDERYAGTRSFYESLGYLPLEEFRDSWPGNPTLLMVKALSPSRGEAAVIGRTTTPTTALQVVDALRAVGLQLGSTAIVHSSLSRLGWVVGGGQAIVDALLAVVGPAGTIVMPAHSSHLSEPSKWQNPPVPESWWPVIREHTPAFHPYLTPPIAMGEVAECFLRHPATVRSAHPAMSFMANGRLAAEVVAVHRTDDAVGPSSPLGRLYDLGARIVLLGVDHGNNTALHLAETRTEWARTHTARYGAPVMVDGQRRWHEYDDLDYDSDDFPALGRAFAAEGGETRVPLGLGVVIACDMRAIVDFGVVWIDASRHT